MEVEHQINMPLELNYWDMRGIAQPIRHLLEYLGVNYTEKIAECPIKYYTKDVQEIKKKCVSANLPYINDNNFYVTEISAIVKYICRKFNRAQLLGKNVKDRCKIDELLSRYTAHRNRICDKINNSVQFKDPVVRREMIRKEFQDINKGSYWEPICKEILKNGWYLGYFSVADFFIYETTFYMSGLFPLDFAKYEYFTHFKQRFEEIPEIAAYKNSGKEKLKLFMVDIAAVWSGDPKYVIGTCNSGHPVL